MTGPDSTSATLLRISSNLASPSDLEWLRDALAAGFALALAKDGEGGPC